MTRLSDIIQRWRDSGIFGATVEYTLFHLQRAKLERLFETLHQKKYQTSISIPPLSSRVIPSSMRDEHYRLEASKALHDDKPLRALRLINLSLSVAERRNNKYGMGIAYAARATIRRQLKLPGVHYDRTRAHAIMSELEILGCYILSIEGWEDPSSGGQEPN